MPDQTEDQPGVWVVADDLGDSDNVVVFPTEMDALRFANSLDNYGRHRARFLPFGTSLHDLNYPPKGSAS
ncbi:hypothetical protein [Nocardia sp. NPDC057440]|uniref:hypothetical protein n=1 Tax=Nocardia sp. NPDC057440 TaxID=3346134 RepID=UPI00366EA083